MKKNFAWIAEWKRGIPSNMVHATSWMCHCHTACKTPLAFHEHRLKCTVPVPQSWFDSSTDP